MKNLPFILIYFILLFYVNTLKANDDYLNAPDSCFSDDVKLGAIEQVKSNKDTGNGCPYDQEEWVCDIGSNSNTNYSISITHNKCSDDGRYGGNGAWIYDRWFQYYCKDGYVPNSDNSDCIACTEDDITFTPPDDGNWTLVDEAYEQNDLNCSVGTIFEAKENCQTKFQCWQKILPKFDCESLGDDWEYNSASDEQSCLEWVNSQRYISASFKTGTDIEPTCCLQNDDNVDTDGDGLTDNEESDIGTNYNNPDTDGDGEGDNEEHNLDTDNDGLIDALESSQLDSDGDGVDDEHDYNIVTAHGGSPSSNSYTVTNGNTSTTYRNNSDGSVTTAVTTTNSDGTTTTQTTTTNLDGSTTTQTVTTSSDGTTTTETTTSNPDGSTTTQTTTTNPDGSSSTTVTTTPTDGNSTVVANYNSSTTDTILNGIKSDIGDAKNILDTIRSDIETASSKNHSDLESIKNSIDNASNRNHQDLESVKNSIDNASSINHQDLESIKNSIDNSLSMTDSDLQQKDNFEQSISSIGDNVNSAYNSMLTSFNNFAVTTLGTAPVVVADSTNCDFSFTVYGRTITISLDIVQNLRQYFDVIYFLILAWFNFRIYLYIFDKVVQKA